MPNQVVIPKGSPPPLGPYSPGMKAGNIIYVAGTLPLDKEGKLVGGNDIRAQTRQVLESIESVIEAGGETLVDVTLNMIFIKDMSDFGKMNEVYAEYFPKNPPARYTIRADLVKPEILIEISSIAHL